MTVRLAAAALLALWAARAGAGLTETVPLHVPAGVAGEAERVVLVRAPQGGVDALELETGAALWSVDAPARPLLVAGGVAWVLEHGGAAGARVSARDARSGADVRAWPVGPEALPAWTLARDDGRLATTLALHARLLGARLEVGWDAVQVAPGGAGPRTLAAGAGVFSLDTREPRPAVPSAGAWAGPRLAQAAPQGAGPLASFHARVGDDAVVLGGPPRDVGGLLLAHGDRIGFVRDAGRVVVLRWAPGARTTPPAARRSEIAADADAIWVTLDRRHVALRRARDQRRVDVHALSDGARLATLEAPLDLSVAGGRVLWTLRRGDDVVLAATEAGTGKTSWSRTVATIASAAGEPLPAAAPR